MAHTRILHTGSSNVQPKPFPAHLLNGSRLETIVPAKPEGVDALSKEIQDMAGKAKAHYVALGAGEMYSHSVSVLLAALKGKLLMPSTNGADPFSKKLAELILYHPLESESHLPGASFSPGFESRFALNAKFKQLDSEKGERSAEYVKLLNDPSTDLTDLLIVLYTRIADMMTVHDPATIKAAASTNMPGVFPVHSNWNSVKDAWADPMLHIYCPIADWGGQTTAYREMRDNAIRYLYPKEFLGILAEVAKYMEALSNTTRILQDLLHRMSEKLNLKVLVAQDYNSVSKAFPKLDKDTVAVSIRPFKGVGGLLNKSIKRDIPVSKVHDWAGATVIADSQQRMYDVVAFLYEEGIAGAVREAGVKEFHTIAPKDYVVAPKPVTLYQSVHIDTVSVDPKMVPLELIVRTAEMHKKADEGTAGHDVYKFSPLRNGERSRFKQRLAEISAST